MADRALLNRMMSGRLAFAFFMAAAFSAFGEPQSFFRLDPGNTKDLPPGVQWIKEGPNGEICLRVDIPPSNPSGMALLTVPIDIEALRDHEILLSYDVRAQDVSMPAHNYNGIKAQLHYESAEAGPKWFNEGLLTDTFPWKHSSFLVRVDPDATKGELQLGMQECSGTAWLANITIQVLAKKPQRPPHRRGLVSSATYAPDDLAAMAAWNANLIRWQLINPAWTRNTVPGDPATYEQWLGPKLDELGTVLEQARKLGMKVVVDLHFPPGGRYADGTLRMVMEKPLQDYFMKIWTRIAQRYKGHPALWAYDIMNEPLQNRPSPPGVLDWFDLQEETARKVRAIDPDTAILIAADQWDAPEAFAWMRPVKVPNVIYTVHMYWPYEFTHQGTDGRAWVNPEEKPAYPGTFNTLPFNKDALIKKLEPVRDFQLNYGTRIFVGEFSVARWAPGAAQFLIDELSIFEAYNWDWAYHAFREESAWSLEDSNLPYGQAVRAMSPTDRQQAIQYWFNQNERPH